MPVTQQPAATYRPGTPGMSPREEVAVGRHRGQAAPLRDDERLGKDGHVRLECRGKVTQNGQVSRDVLDLESGGQLLHVEATRVSLKTADEQTSSFLPHVAVEVRKTQHRLGSADHR